MTAINLDEKSQFREAIRSLLLPITQANEGVCLAEAENELKLIGVASTDFGIWIKLKTAEWRDTSTPDPNLARIIKTFIKSGDPDLGEKVGSKYLSVHSRLQKKPHDLTHQEASAFLSHALLIVRLARVDRMSAAQIAKVLVARDARIPFSYQSLKLLLGILGEKPDLDTASVQQLFCRDKGLEEAMFADADIKVSAENISEVGANLGFPGNLANLLLKLCKPDATTFGPYLQILHYQCVIAEFYDHAVTNLYEFFPRGTTALWLFDQYPPVLTGAGNPFLNNAKSVEEVSVSWARSKKSNQAEARALVDLLSGLEEMGFAARQELASLLRQWLLRIVRLKKPLGHKLPEAVSEQHVKNLLESVKVSGSRTAGILEQRIVDAVTSLRHRKTDGWRSRGLGDSVNASNVSRLKLGDCDYQHVALRRIRAYESHAGRLTAVYLQEHLRVVRKILPARIKELAGIADAEEWAVEIVFVAHDFAIEAPEPISINGITISTQFLTFKEFIAGLSISNDLLGAIKSYVYQPINEKRTPENVRKVLFGLAKHQS